MVCFAACSSNQVAHDDYLGDPNRKKNKCQNPPNSALIEYPQILVSKSPEGVREIRAICPEEYRDIFGSNFIREYKISPNDQAAMRQALGDRSQELSRFTDKVRDHLSNPERLERTSVLSALSSPDTSLLSALWQKRMTPDGARKAIYLAKLGNLPKGISVSKPLYGVFAADTIDEGDFIGAYVGEAKKNTEWCRLKDHAYRVFTRSPRNDYRLMLDVRWVSELAKTDKPINMVLRIYGDQFQNEIPHVIHHESAPNTFAHVIYDGKYPYLILIAARRIEKNEQIFWNYGPDYRRGREAALVDLGQTTDLPIQTDTN